MLLVVDFYLYVLSYSTKTANAFASKIEAESPDTVVLNWQKHGFLRFVLTFYAFHYSKMLFLSYLGKIPKNMDFGRLSRAYSPPLGCLKVLLVVCVYTNNTL